MIPFSYGPLKSLKKSYIFASSKSQFSNITVGNLCSHSFSGKKIASYLENCPDTSSLRKLHACVITQGLEQNTFLGSKLLNSFLKFNLLAEARWVFKQINVNNLSRWDSIIVGCFRADQYSEVLGLYSNLRQKNIGIHSAPIIFALKSCVELGNFLLGRNLQTDAFKFGLSYDQRVCSSLIKFYSNCDEIEEAAKVFDEITERDVVAYTSMITGYAQVSNRHDSNKAFKFACDMQRDGFEPNRVTLVSLLHCASQLGRLEEGKSIHGYAIRRQIGCQNEVFETSLLDMYVKCGDPDSGAVIFDKMSEKTTGSWNALVAGHLRLGQPLEAFDLFRRMVGNCALDLIAIANGLLSCADLGYLLEGKAIHCQVIREGVDLDLVGTTASIVMYSKCKHLSSAMKIFYGTEAKDDALFNAMIASYLNNGCIFRAMEMFHEMVIMCVKPDTGTVISVLSALSDMEDVRTGKSIHGYAFRRGLEVHIDVTNQFIYMYAKCGLIGWARRVFDRMKIKDRVSWTAMMTGFVNHGLANEAMTLFLLMERDNLHPDAVTFTCLLQALNRLGSVILTREVHARLYRVCLELEKDTILVNCLINTYSKWGKIEMASNLFKHMAEKDLPSWNTMIAGYGMHGDFVQALKLIEEMKKENVVPDGGTFKSILSACSHTGLIDEGLHAFSSMEKDYGIVPSDEHYSRMVDLLGRAGRLEEAYGILKHVPSIQNASTIGALLAACRIYGNLEMGERIGQWLLDVEPENASGYCSVSNMYAGGGRWDEVSRIGTLAKGKGLRRTPGYSLIDFK